jgi:hypothetical protein
MRTKKPVFSYYLLKNHDPDVYNFMVSSMDPHKKSLRNL